MRLLPLAVATLVAVPTAAEQPSNPPPPTAERGPGGSSGRLFVSPMGEPFRGGEAPQDRWFAGADADHDGRITRTEFLADAMRFFTSLDLNHDQQIGPSEIDRYEREVLPEIGQGRDGIDDDSFAAGSRRRPADGRRREGPSGGMGGGSRRGGGSGGGRSHGINGDGDAGVSEGNEGTYTFRPSGAGRFGYLATPEPVTAADVDLDRVITAREFLAAAGRRFEILDRNGDGFIDARELPKLRR